MTASPTPAEKSSLVSPVVDYEPPPVGAAPCRSTSTLRRRVPRRSPCPSGGRYPQHPVPSPPVPEAVPPRDAIVFADVALRRVLEVIDRRRPIAQLRPLLAPALIDTVIALTRSPHTAAATLRRVRLRMVDAGPEAAAAEVFGSYTRGPRVRAIAARVELTGDRWRIVGLQLG